MKIDHGFTTDMKYAVCGTFTGGLSSKIYPLLKKDWYNVKALYPVVANQTEINGDKAYLSLDNLPEKIDVVVTVHKPEITLELVEKIITMESKLGIWFMPGTASKESIELCEKNSIQYGKSCLMGHRQFTGIGRIFNLHNIHGFVGKWNKVPKQMS